MNQQTVLLVMVFQLSKQLLGMHGHFMWFESLILGHQALDISTTDFI
jgi:hypothetical protein